MAENSHLVVLGKSTIGRSWTQFRILVKRVKGIGCTVCTSDSSAKLQPLRVQKSRAECLGESVKEIQGVRCVHL